MWGRGEGVPISSIITEVIGLPLSVFTLSLCCGQPRQPIKDLFRRTRIVVPLCVALRTAHLTLQHLRQNLIQCAPSVGRQLEQLLPTNMVEVRTIGRVFMQATHPDLLCLSIHRNLIAIFRHLVSSANGYPHSRPNTCPTPGLASKRQERREGSEGAAEAPSRTTSAAVTSPDGSSLQSQSEREFHLWQC